MLINETYKVIHFTNVTDLKIQSLKLQTHINNLQDSDYISSDIVESLKKISLDQYYKLEMISETRNKKVKRGLMNGLGNAISWLTGLMTADDKEHLDKVIDKIENNELHLVENEKHNFALNHELIKKFNFDVEHINSNNKALENITNETANIVENMQAVDLITLTMQLLDDEINDVVDSLMYCKEGKLHPSILSFDDFRRLINYKNYSLASRDLSILWEISNSTCILSKSVITYVIHLPKSNDLFERYDLLSYPVEMESKVHTMKLKEKSISVSQNKKLWKLTNCQIFSSISFCTSGEMINDNCILSVVNNKDLDSCVRIEIINDKPFMNYFENCNCILGYKFDQIKINNDTINTPSSFLINLDINDKMTDMKLPFTSVTTYAQKLSHVPNKIHTKLIDLKDVSKLDDIEPRDLDFINFEDSFVLKTHHIVIFVSITLLIMVISIVYSKFKAQNNVLNTVQIPLAPVSTFNTGVARIL